MSQSQNYGSFSAPTKDKAGLQQAIGGCLPCTNCLVTVPQDKYYAIEQFGSFVKIIEPGIHFAGLDVCGCCLSFRTITRRVEQNECVVETKTKDNVFVLVKVAVQQSVIPDQAQTALYRLANVNQQVDAYVSDVVRSHIPKMTLDEAFENKDAVSTAIQDELCKVMSDYGFTIHKALVTELRPSQDVVNSMNEINKQKRLRDAAQMAAEADKIRIEVNADANAKAARLQGEGIASQREAIVTGLKRSISTGTGEELTSEKVSELMLITQYFETLKEIGANSKATTVFIPHSPGDALSDIAGQIRNGALQGKAAKT